MHIAGSDSFRYKIPTSLGGKKQSWDVVSHWWSLASHVPASEIP